MARDQHFDRVVVQEDLDPDVTPRVVDAFARLFADRDLLEALTDHLPLGAVASNDEGVVTLAVGAAFARIGLGGGQLVGTPVAWRAGEGADGSSSDRVQVYEFDGINGGTPFRYRTLSVPDGASGVRGLMVDLTETLTLERENDANRALLDAAMERSGAWMVLQDPHGRVVSLNHHAREGLGIDRGAEDPIAAILALDPVHEDGSPFTEADFPTTLARATGVPQRNVVVGVRSGEGRRWMHVTSLHMVLEDQRTTVTSWVDIAEREATVDLLRDSDERFRLLAEEAPIGIFVVDTAGEVLYINPAAEELSGRSATELREVGWMPVVHPEDQQRLAEGPTDFDDFDPVEYRLVRPDGEMRWVRASGAAIRDRNGEVIGLVGTAADVTEIRKADERLRDSESRSRAILETAAEGIVSTDESGRILDFNAAAERIFGYDSDEVVEQRSFLALLDEPSREVVRDFMLDYLVLPPAEGQTRIVGETAAEATGLRKDGTTVPIELSVTDIQTNRGRLFTAVIRDLSQHKEFERELEHLATHDPLTGLPNRALFSAQLEAALARADRLRRNLAVLFIDIDRVKLVTEALGHRAGDELIVQVAGRLTDTVGSVATLARFSNDQFVALLEEQDGVSSAVDAAVRIIESIDEPFVAGADEAFVSASVGIAIAVEGLGDAETLISNADVAMGRAKASIARYEVFDSEMRAWVEAQRKTEIALRHGVERHEFELYYQPVVALDTNEVSGYEALMRWNHPNKGVLAPAEFMPLAEESGLIVPLGEHVLREAIRQSALWAADPAVARSNVAINLSARQLESPDLPDIVRRALDEFGTDPSTVAFEITETVLLDDVETVVRTLDELKDLGVRLSLDDFGTGYSSLTYLCRLPIDIVKVDRSFVSQLGTGSRDASIVEMVVTMARTLQLDVVAEGVETEEQAAVLRGWGCRFAQGYLFARPQPVGRAGEPPQA